MHRWHLGWGKRLDKLTVLKKWGKKLILYHSHYSSHLHRIPTPGHALSATRTNYLRFILLWRVMHRSQYNAAKNPCFFF